MAILLILLLSKNNKSAKIFCTNLINLQKYLTLENKRNVLLSIQKGPLSFSDVEEDYKDFRNIIIRQSYLD